MWICALLSRCTHRAHAALLLNGSRCFHQKLTDECNRRLDCTRPKHSHCQGNSAGSGGQRISDRQEEEHLTHSEQRRHQMAVSTCIKCSGHSFEVVLFTPIGGSRKLSIMQCSSCG